MEQVLHLYMSLFWRTGMLHRRKSVTDAATTLTLHSQSLHYQSSYNAGRFDQKLDQNAIFLFELDACNFCQIKKYIHLKIKGFFSTKKTNKLS